MTKEYAENRIAILMGGRVAEELIFGKITTGAGQDIVMATQTARNMVCQWGMSAKLGPLAFGRKDDQVFLGREISQSRDFSERTAMDIDDEVRRIVMEGYETATRLIDENMAMLKTLAEALLERETLDATEVVMVVRGEELPAPKPSVEEEARRKPKTVFVTSNKDTSGIVGDASTEGA